MTPEIRRLTQDYRTTLGLPDDRVTFKIPDETVAAALLLADAVMEELDREHPEHAHLWKCGCLRNDGGAHRVGCPDHPEGVRGARFS